MNHPPHGSHLSLAAAFAVVMALMVTLGLVGLHYMEEANRRLERVVHVNNAKFDRVVQIRQAARERSLILHKMLLLDDPFALDEEWLRFLAYGAEASADRAALIKMGIDAEERAILDAQAALSGPAFAIYDRIAELILEERKPEAAKLLAEQAMPLQERVFEQFNRLYRYEESLAEQATREAAAGYDEARRLLYGIGGLVLLISVVLALRVTLRTRRAELKLQREKEQAEVTLRSIGDGVITTDADGRILCINQKAELLTGWSVAEAKGRALGRVFRLLRERDRKEIDDPVHRAIRETITVDSAGDVLLVDRAGRDHAVEFTVAPIRDRDHQPTGTIVVFHDVTAMRSLSHQLSYQASHDPLTGLINRREFEQRLTHALENARAEELHHVLCFLDLDQFKIVNDTCGHQAGDELLKQLAVELRGVMRSGDALARLGGDEFGVLLENCPDAKALELAERMRRTIQAHHFIWGENAFDVGVSIGMVPLGPTSGTLYDAMSLADAACYVAKDAGRNRIHLHHDDDDAVSNHSSQMKWVQRIQQALDEERFQLHVQEIRPLAPAHHRKATENADPSTLAGRTPSSRLDVESATPASSSGPFTPPERRLGALATPSGDKPAPAADRRSHYEVLLRMIGRDGEIIPPAAFLPSAERYHLMPFLDRWVVDRLFSELTENPIDEAIHPVFAVNLSGQSLGDPDFADFLLERLHRCGLPPHRFCFEITETAAITNLTAARKLVQTVRSIGASFALDDFGSGLSSFSYLKNLSVDYIKIDGCFVRDIADDLVDRKLVESMNQVAKVLGLRTVAEFVESDEIEGLLGDMGVDYAQGYAVSRPHALGELLVELTIDEPPLWKMA